MNAEAFRRRALNKGKKEQSRLRWIYCLAARHRRFRSIAMRQIGALEGGQMWSWTFRELLNRYYSVELGMHSYSLDLARSPGALPPGTRVGNYCSLAAGLRVFRRNHPVDRLSQHPFFYNPACELLDEDTIETEQENPLTIGHDVWIGERVLITPSCRKIGNGAVVAAGAVVTTDIAPLAVVGGIPAKPMRWRFSEDLRIAWMESAWWLKPVNELADHLDVMTERFTGSLNSKLS